MVSLLSGITEVLDLIVVLTYHATGGAIGVPQWGKYWLSCLNLYDWDGVNPVPPELWYVASIANMLTPVLIWSGLGRLLPDWIPFHPSKWWVQCRVVYLPVSYLYANKCQIPLNQFLKNLREEIFAQPFLSIDFAQHRNTVAPTDIKRPNSLIVSIMNPVVRAWEAYGRPSWLHRRANNTVRDLMQREDDNTSYNDLAPVSKALQMTAIYFSDREGSASIAKHRETLPTYLWQSNEGMTSCGTNGVQVWDTAFTVLAVVEAGLAKDYRFKVAMNRALDFLDVSQLRDNLSDPYRQQRKGGWPFSTKENGYIVSDCAAESMKAVILLQEDWLVS